MPYFLSLFTVFYLFMIYLWIFKDKANHENIRSIFDFFIEKDFEFILNHLGKYDVKKEIHKRIKGSIIVLLFCLIFISESMKLDIVLTSIILAVLFYKVQYILIKKKYERKLMEADIKFPYYLNNLCILVQNNAVPIALDKSIAFAPILFKKDLEILVDDIHQGYKKGIIPYIEFSDKFGQVKDLQRVVKTLFNISIASASKEKMVLSLTKITNERVLNARKDHFNGILDKQALIPWISFLWVGIVLIVSFASINLGEFLT